MVFQLLAGTHLIDVNLDLKTDRELYQTSQKLFALILSFGQGTSSHSPDNYAPRVKAKINTCSDGVRPYRLVRPAGRFGRGSLCTSCSPVVPQWPHRHSPRRAFAEGLRIRKVKYALACCHELIANGTLAAFLYSSRRTFVNPLYGKPCLLRPSTQAVVQSLKAPSLHSSISFSHGQTKIERCKRHFIDRIFPTS